MLLQHLLRRFEQRLVHQNTLIVLSNNTITVTTDWTSVQLNSFSVACAVAFEPIDKKAIEKAVSAASCDATGNTVSSASSPSASYAGHLSPGNDRPVIVPQYSAPIDEGAFLGENGEGGPSNDFVSPVSVSSSVFESPPTLDTGASSIVVPIASTSTVSFFKPTMNLSNAHSNP
jgi:hypothetical protein